MFFKGSITHFTSALDQELKKAPLVKDLIIEREQRIIREIELERLRGEEELQRNATEAALSLMEANTATAPIEASTVIDEKKEGADDGDGGVDDEMNDVNAYFDSLALDPADQGVEVQAISVLPEEGMYDECECLYATVSPHSSLL